MRVPCFPGGDRDGDGWCREVQGYTLAYLWAVMRSADHPPGFSGRMLPLAPYCSSPLTTLTTTRPPHNCQPAPRGAGGAELRNSMMFHIERSVPSSHAHPTPPSPSAGTCCTSSMPPWRPPWLSGCGEPTCCPSWPPSRCRHTTSAQHSVAALHAHSASAAVPLR